jgi:hypothetical protein
MMRIHIGLGSVGALLVLFFAGGCASFEANPRLQATIDVLLTQVSDQSTRVANQDMFMSYLATRMPPPAPTPFAHPLPTPFVRGSIQIEDGLCCVGALAGQTIGIRVTFQASSPLAEVLYMRVRTGPTTFDELDFSEAEWRPFTPTQIFDYLVPLNWSGFCVTAQFKDAFGHLSAVYSSDISVEGMPPGPTVATP